VTYIQTTPEKLWEALIKPEYTKQYWMGCWQESDWKPGSPWRLVAPDGRVTDSGTVVEFEPRRRLVLSWRNEFVPEMHAEGYSRATFEFEKQDDAVKLTVTHEINKQGSKFIQGVSGGWPSILSSLKSLLETGESLAATRHWPKGL
jgi:uncharacterized protein YndB with AHSA1/START domain